MEGLSPNQNANIDFFGQQENDEINDTLNENLHNEEFLDDELTCNFSESGFSCSTHPVFQDSLINENIGSLNVKQRQIFDVIHKWARDYVKNLSSRHVKYINPFIFFLQLELVLISQTLSRLFLCQLVIYFLLKVVILKNQ